MIFESELRPLMDTRKRTRIKPTFAAIILWQLIFFTLQFCSSSCSDEDSFSVNRNQLVDLSYEFNKDTIYYPTVSSLMVNIIHNGTREGSGWYQIEEISAGTHGGTHMDAPCHVVKGKMCISDIPIDRLIAPVALINISEHVKDDALSQLSVDHLLAWEKENGQIPEQSVVMILTGWSRFWPNKLKYAGTMDKDVNKLKFPSIHPDAAQWIVDNRNIVGIGIDTMSVDKPGSKIPRTHQILEEKNIYGLENVNGNLQLLPAVGATVFVMPMKLQGASGAPCRVIAALPMTAANGCSNIYLSYRATLILLTLGTIFLICKKSLID